MPSAIWTGSISFGLVTVPVRLVSATRSLDVRFHQLDPDTGARIRYKRVSEASGEEIPNERIVRGYEIGAGQYVIVEAEEMAALAPEASRRIDIEDFVELSDIDPVYFEQPYYLIPDKDATKAYRLLVDAMSELSKVAIGRFVLRTKEVLVAIRPKDGMLCLETMRYADEVLAAERPELASAPTDRELDMARQLVNALSGSFDPDKYHDTYRESLLGLIEQKAAGEEVVAAPVVEEPAKVLDLMAALEASLARTTERQKAGARDGAKGATGKARRAPASEDDTADEALDDEQSAQAESPAPKRSRARSTRRSA